MDIDEKYGPKIGPYIPISESKYGTSKEFGRAIFTEEKDGYQYAQLNSHNSGKSFGWWRFPKGTFVEDVKEE